MGGVDVPEDACLLDYLHSFYLFGLQWKRSEAPSRRRWIGKVPIYFFANWMYEWYEYLVCSSASMYIWVSIGQLSFTLICVISVSSPPKQPEANLEA